MKRAGPASRQDAGRLSRSESARAVEIAIAGKVGGGAGRVKMGFNPHTGVIVGQALYHVCVSRDEELPLQLSEQLGAKMPAKIETGAVQLGAMLRVGSTYKVPPFQRDYSWSDEEYGRLWEDIFATIKNRRDDYFLGSMVINDSEPSTLVVVDGQQRLISVSVLICALRDIAREQGIADTAARLTSDFLGRFDYESNLTVPRLEPNKANRSFYVEKILDQADLAVLGASLKQRDISKSNKRLASAYLYFRAELSRLIAAGQNVSQLVADIIGALDNKLSVIQIKVKDDYDAYLLFETLNDRGLALSVADLLKNYLFSKAGDQLSDVQENWDRMAMSLAGHEIKTYLRHYWLSREGVIRDKELYREITNRFAARAAVVRLSRELRDSASFYAAFSDPENDWWDTFDPQVKRKIKHLIHQLNLFGVSQYHPLLLAAIEDHDAVFEQVLTMACIFSFRYSVVGGKGPGNVEKAVSDAARFLRANRACTAKDVFGHLQHLYPADDEFRALFRDKEVRQAALARYVLAKINDHLMGRAGVITNPNPEEVNLEHILPRSPTAAWLGDFDNDLKVAEEYIYRLGNMTLLGAKLNKNVANSPFPEKKAKAYSQKPLDISRPLLVLDTWNKGNLEQRQEWLADLAVQIWRLDY